VLCSVPGATILEIGEHGIRPSAWDELELVRHWRGFLEAPERYLKHLAD
jgi:predicted ATPase